MSKDIEIIEHVTPNEVIKNKTKGIDMPITKKVLEQVQCSACLKYMSEKNLRYSHPKYCLERTIIDTPIEIPIPKLKVKNDESIQNKIVLPVKSVTMKRTRTVIVDSTPNLESEHVPIVVQPVVTMGLLSISKIGFSFTITTGLAFFNLRFFTGNIILFFNASSFFILSLGIGISVGVSIVVRSKQYFG